MLIELSKKDYSEAVVRKALYWLAEDCPWTMDATDEAWVVSFPEPRASAQDCATALSRLLNDFSLREALDARTRGMRLAVVEAALKRLSGTPNAR